MSFVKLAAGIVSLFNGLMGLFRDEKLRQAGRDENAVSGLTEQAKKVKLANSAAIDPNAIKRVRAKYARGS
jgi:hypothetical protein